LRHKVNAPAFASFDGVTGGMILDLSEQGMSMHTVAPLEPNRRLQFHLSLPEPATYLDTEGYVAWADALGRAGVRFTELPEDAQFRLNQWLTQNANAPSRKAPKFAVGEFSLPGRSGKTPGEAGKEHLEISLEPANRTEQPRSFASASTTMQYEFNPLGPDLNSALRLISERARALTRATSAAIALAQQGPMRCCASLGACAPPLGTELAIDSGLSGECIRSGKAQRCDDAENDPRVDAETCLLLGVRSIVAAPIRYEREIVGLLEVLSEKSFAFDEGDVAVAESLAHTVVLALSHNAKPKTRLPGIVNPR